MVILIQEDITKNAFRTRKKTAFAITSIIYYTRKAVKRCALKSRNGNKRI